MVTLDLLDSQALITMCVVETIEGSTWHVVQMLSKALGTVASSDILLAASPHRHQRVPMEGRSWNNWICYIPPRNSLIEGGGGFSNPAVGLFF